MFLKLTFTDIFEKIMGSLKEGECMSMQSGFFSGLQEGEIFEVRGIGFDEGRIVRVGSGDWYDASGICHNDYALMQAYRARSMMDLVDDVLAPFDWEMEYLGIFGEGGSSLGEPEVMEKWSHDEAREKKPLLRFMAHRMTT